mgnify:CR=1 FL=1
MKRRQIARAFCKMKSWLQTEEFVSTGTSNFEKQDTEAREKVPGVGHSEQLRRSNKQIIAEHDWTGGYDLVVPYQGTDADLPKRGNP